MKSEREIRKDIHKNLCNELHDIYTKKDGDYGSSFTKQYNKYGLTSALIRLNDKLSRLEALTNGVKQQVNDESIDDTLLDLANYALLALVERKYESGNFDCFSLSAPEQKEKETEKTSCEMSEEGFKNLINAIFAEEVDDSKKEEKVNLDEIFVGDLDIEDDDDDCDDCDDDDDDHDIYDIYKTLEDVYGKASNELNKLKQTTKNNTIKKEKSIEPKTQSSFYKYNCKYNPEDNSLEIYINDNGKEEKKNIPVKEEKENSKVQELKDKGIHAWDLSDLCKFF